MLLETEADEIMLQLPQTLFTDHELTLKAVDVWREYFDAPRERTMERIDAGVPRPKSSQASLNCASHIQMVWILFQTE